MSITDDFGWAMYLKLRRPLRLAEDDVVENDIGRVESLAGLLDTSGGVCINIFALDSPRSVLVPLSPSG